MQEPFRKPQIFTTFGTFSKVKPDNPQKVIRLWRQTWRRVVELLWVKRESTELFPLSKSFHRPRPLTYQCHCARTCQNVSRVEYVPIQTRVHSCAMNPWYIWMPISNSNKLYQFHIEARPTNSYVYFCETIRTQPHFFGLRNSHNTAPHHSNSIRVRYSNSVDTRVGLHVRALPQRRYGLPHHGAVSRDHYLIYYIFHS